MSTIECFTLDSMELEDYEGSTTMPETSSSSSPSSLSLVVLTKLYV